MTSAGWSVPSVTFSSLLRSYGVRAYLKIDIEGADMLCLDGLLSASGSSDFVSLRAIAKTISALRSDCRS